MGWAGGDGGAAVSVVFAGVDAGVAVGVDVDVVGVDAGVAVVVVGAGVAPSFAFALTFASVVGAGGGATLRLGTSMGIPSNAIRCGAVETEVGRGLAHAVVESALESAAAKAHEWRMASVRFMLTIRCDGRASA